MPDGRVGRKQKAFDIDGDVTDDPLLQESEMGIVMTPVNGTAVYFARKRTR